MVLISILLWIVPVLGVVCGLGDQKTEKLKAELLPACQACTLFVTSFNKGFERTSRFKFEGGDADWEEKNQGKYASSEVRLVEIQEDMCKEVVRGQQQCHSMLAEQEELLEEWWFSQRQDNADLHRWLCIDKLKRCCPENTFGADCSPCPGGVEKPCGGRGKCTGAGTRKGNGECKCDKGYSGLVCDQCSVGFYIEPNLETLLCSDCHKACQGHCREGGPKGCEVCKDGWLYHSELGCQDIDECVVGTQCKENQFCANTEGSFLCVDCYKSCATCVSDGPDMCKTCAEGYVHQDGLCIDNDTWMRNAHSQYTRYLTYAGLCIATFIILRKSPAIAGIIGLAVAVYIGMSEYTVTKSGVYEIHTRTTDQ